MNATVGHSSPGVRSRPHFPAPTAISVSHLRKSFRLPHEQYNTLKERVLHPFRARRVDIHQAVDDVSVEIREGEFFGIVGRNGSGKSTLLKCLAGIYDSDDGEVVIRGRLSPFIELGVGFNPDLPARDNVLINAIMLGLSRSEAKARFDDIVRFAELEDYMDLKLKNYSSGMQVRLAFAVAIQVEAEILLIDEVLAVGDVAFQQKCFDEFTRLKSEGRTIVFVTHDMSAIERFCDRAMLLERGKVVDIGDPSAVAQHYNALNFDNLRPSGAVADVSAETRSPSVEILAAAFESPSGETLVACAQGEPCCVRLDVRFRADVEDPVFSAGIFDELGHVAFAAHSDITNGSSGLFRAGEAATIRMEFANWLAPGRYHLTASVYRNSAHGDTYEKLEDVTSVIVHSARAGGGVVDLPHTFEIRRG